jgi:hypothetical protein
MYRELARRYVLGKSWESGVGGQCIGRVSGRERRQPPTQAKERLEWATRHPPNGSNPMEFNSVNH